MARKREGEPLTSPQKKQKKNARRQRKSLAATSGSEEPLSSPSKPGPSDPHIPPKNSAKTPAIINPTAPGTVKTVAQYDIPVDEVEGTEKTGSRLKSLIPLILVVNEEMANNSDGSLGDSEFRNLLVEANNRFVTFLAVFMTYCMLDFFSFETRILHSLKTTCET
jgi:hypothetical protein